MGFGGATAPALTTAGGEITARATSTARPTYVEYKAANGTEAHAAVGTSDVPADPSWGRAAPGTESTGAMSAAPGVTAPSGLPRVASPYTGIVDDMAPGSAPDGPRVRYANRDRYDGLVQTGPTHDLHAQSTDEAGHVQLYEAESRTRRQEQFPNQRQGFGLTPTSPAATPVTVRIGQVAPDPETSNGQFHGSLNNSTLGAVWNGSGSAYNPTPGPADAVIVDGQGGAGGGGMRSWG